MRHRHSGRGFAIALALCAAPAFVGAQSARVAAPRGAAQDGVVVQIDQQDVMISLPGGAPSAGERYQVMRPIEVRNPLTGRLLHDRFPIGVVSVVTAGATLSIARAQGNFTRPVQVGDVLVPLTLSILPAAGAQPAPTRGATTSAAPAAQQPQGPVALPGATVEERAALALWLSTVGRRPEERAALYRAYLSAHADSRFAGDIRRELDVLVSLGAQARHVTELEAVISSRPALPPPPPPPPEPAPVAPSLDGNQPGGIRAGDPLSLALQTPAGSPLREGVVHARHANDLTYQDFPVHLGGDGYLRFRFPDALVTAPGVQYFVELIDAQGAAVPVFGTASEPRHIEVAPPIAPTPLQPGRSRIEVRGEWADVGSQWSTDPNVGSRPEWFAHVEGDFFQRVQVGPLYGYRVGFGTYTGWAQPLSAFDNPNAAPPTQASVAYGYHELEFAFSDFIHVMGRGEIGVRENRLAPGAQLRMRVGRERATNSVFGGEVLDGVGQRAFFLLNFFPHARVPTTVAGEVFNREGDGNNPMFRFIGEVGYRIAPAMSVSLRGSYQLRRLSSGGFGGGLNLTFDW